jgi:hypothetical protein
VRHREALMARVRGALSGKGPKAVRDVQDVESEPGADSVVHV